MIVPWRSDASGSGVSDGRGEKSRKRTFNGGVVVLPNVLQQGGQLSRIPEVLIIVKETV